MIGFHQPDSRTALYRRHLSCRGLLAVRRACLGTIGVFIHDLAISVDARILSLSGSTAKVLTPAYRDRDSDVAAAKVFFVVQGEEIIPPCAPANDKQPQISETDRLLPLIAAPDS